MCLTIKKTMALTSFKTLFKNDGVVSHRRIRRTPLLVKRDTDFMWMAHSHNVLFHIMFFYTFKVSAILIEIYINKYMHYITFFSVTSSRFLFVFFISKREWCIHMKSAYRVAQIFFLTHFIKWAKLHLI